jgi:hypothetical protein
MAKETKSSKSTVLILLKDKKFAFIQNVLSG